MGSVHGDGQGWGSVSVPAQTSSAHGYGANRRLTSTRRTDRQTDND